MNLITHPRNARDAWIRPRDEPEGIDFHRDVPWWELLPVVERVTDESYRQGPVAVWMWAERVRG